MRIIIAIAILLVSLFVAVSCQQTPKADGGKPAVVFTTLTGKDVKLSSLSGKWVVLNYWASWCKPCYKEVPALNKFAAKYKHKAVVLGVSLDRAQADEMSSIIKKMDIKFTTLKYDPAQDLGIDTLAGIPATVIINPKGQIVKTLFGEQTESSLAKAIA